MNRLVIGIDVSKEMLDYSIYDGKTHVKGTLQNQMKDIGKFFANYGKSKTTLQVVIEVT